MSERNPRATWSRESAVELTSTMTGLDVPFGFRMLNPVMWWEFWRWRVAFQEDYHLSRASEIILLRKMARAYLEEHPEAVRDGKA